MEPWDGPASIAFTDGIRIGAVLDRNGLRPSRYYVTKDDWLSWRRGGCSGRAPERVLHKGRLQPGRNVPDRYRAGLHCFSEVIKEKIAAETSLRAVDRATDCSHWPMFPW